MNNNVPAPDKTDGATAPTAILGLDLDILHASAPTEVQAFVTHIANCAKAVSSVCINARLPASVTVHVTRQLNADDAEWFANNPARSYRYREPLQGEYVLRLCNVPPPFVLVRQVSKGARLLSPLWFKFDGPTTSVERFEAARNQKQLDRDSILSVFFNVYCAFPGEPLDVRNLLRVLRDDQWFRMVTQASQASTPDEPAS
jgi:hypothetical protein